MTSAPVTGASSPPSLLSNPLALRHALNEPSRHDGLWIVVCRECYEVRVAWGIGYKFFALNPAAKGHFCYKEQWHDDLPVTWLCSALIIDW